MRKPKSLTGTRHGVAELSREAYRTRDGLALGLKRYGELPGRSVMVGVHGISGAADDFDPLGEGLAARGHSMIAWHQRGQGHDPSPRGRGDLADWRLLVEDAGDFLQLVKREAGGRPIFICGESMGALVVAQAAAEGVFKGAAGLVLMSPVVELRGAKPPWWLRWLVHSALTVAPGFRLDPSKLAPKDAGPVRIAGDLDYQLARDAAPHRVREFTFRFFRNLIALTKAAATSAPRIHLPALVVYAGNDYFVHPDAVGDFCSRLSTDDASSRLWPDAYHLLLYDPATPEVVETIASWVEARM